MITMTPKDVVERFRRAKDARSTWESHWQECYDYCLPQRGNLIRSAAPGAKRTDKLFDGTAPDAVDQLAASLLSQLTPPWTQWFGLKAGSMIEEEDKEKAAPAFEQAATTIQKHLDRSNFTVEIHQCYLDLVTVGTACLLVEEAPPGEPSPLRFTAVPLAQAVLEEGPSGRLDTTFRRSELTRAEILARFPQAKIPEEKGTAGDVGRQQKKFSVIEGVMPDKGGYVYMAVLEADSGGAGEPDVLSEGRFENSPYVNFRWLKAPGEVYGRSPVMKALPDIKTANKVVELVLKNATIAVTGIWQADDDGVLNPATIKLTPGSIIPKAVGSAGLTPLEAPGKFDTSQVVLDSLRERIGKALFADKLGQSNAPKMTATEVIERSAEIARVLGATYGRLQSELMGPLLGRVIAILTKRGEIRPLHLDGRMAEVDFQVSLARYQTQNQAKGVMSWLNAIQGLGPVAMQTIDQAALAKWLADAYGVPAHLVRTAKEDPLASDLEDALGGALGEGPSSELGDALKGVGGALASALGGKGDAALPLPPTIAPTQTEELGHDG